MRDEKLDEMKLDVQVLGVSQAVATKKASKRRLFGGRMKTPMHACDIAAKFWKI